MAFELGTYAKLRPTLWHLTHRDNLGLIRTTRTLLPASELFPGPVQGPRRIRHVGKDGVILRDQDLLNEKSVDLEGATFADFIRDLNRRVFFWSGTARGPVRAGRKALSRYATTDIVLRVSFEDIVKDHAPQFTNCNSGATRMQKGHRVRRGPTTFAVGADCLFSPGDVIEVTFLGQVRLPLSTEWSEALGGEFKLLSE
jgi:hypothetical protein